MFLLSKFDCEYCKEKREQVLKNFLVNDFFVDIKNRTLIWERNVGIIGETKS